MIPGARWLAVAAVALVVTSAPLVRHAVPVGDTTISAAALADRIHDAADLGWSGEVRSVGSLQVPLTGSAFGGVARLLGEQSDLRVWWRDNEHWRVDRIRASGESDMVRDAGLTARWDYEDNRVRFTPYTPIRLPEDADVVPAALAARLLAGAKPSELTRLPAQRVAGRTASGLQLVPSDKRSTITHVDVWADASSGLPLRVRVYADPKDAAPILSTELVTLTMERPATEEVRFRFSRAVHFSRGAALDETAGANAFAPFLPPMSVAGLPRRGDPAYFGAVGVYGRGPTAVLAVPLRDSVARVLRFQARRSSTARETGPGVTMEVGPLSVLLQRNRRGNFLLTGTVTQATLAQAAADLADGVVRTR
jgi:hypothetical protein